MGETRKITLTVNGEQRQAEAEVRLTLADFLRLKIMNDGSHIIHEAKIAIVGADGKLMGHIRG